MKPVIIIAIVAAAMIGVMVPSSFAESQFVVEIGSSVPGCEISNSCYLPTDEIIAIKDTISWNNLDTVAHTVTSGSPANGPSGVFDSNLIMPGQSYSFTFEDIGYHDYFCMVHPWMVGSVMTTLNPNGEEDSIIIEFDYESPPDTSENSFKNNIFYNEKHGLTLEYSNMWKNYDDNIAILDGTENIVDLISNSSDFFTIYKSLEWDSVMHPTLLEPFANNIISKIIATCDSLTMENEGMVCYDVSIKNYHPIDIDGITGVQVNYSQTFDEGDFIYPLDGIQIMWSDPSDSTSWHVEIVGQKDNSTFNEAVDIVKSIKFEESNSTNDLTLKEQITSPSSTYVNHEFGFSVTPPVGWIIDDFSGVDKLDGYGGSGLPLIRYIYPNSNADFIYPAILIMIFQPNDKVDFSQYSDPNIMSEEFLYGMTQSGHTGSMISNKSEMILNGIHWTGEFDVQMNQRFENLLPTKINVEIWTFENGLNVAYMYVADPSEYDEFLNEFKESSDTFYFKEQKIIEEKSIELDLPDFIVQESSEESGGCLIATATYGSELAPQVQQLRELRDNQLLQTESGSVFMSTFNQIYYSFSPIIADYERENPYFKEAVKLAITPMISSLSLMENAETESEVLGLGISVIMLNLGMYLGVPATVVIGLRRII